MGLTPDEKDAIQNTLIHQYRTDVEGLTRVLHYLNIVDEKYKDDDRMQTPQVWRTLHLTLDKPVIFKQYADRLVADTKRADFDEEFRNSMNTIYEEMLDPGQDQFTESQGFNDKRKMEVKKATWLSAKFGVVSVMAEDIVAQICNFLPKLNCRAVASGADEVVGFFQGGWGNLVMVGLCGVFLTFEAYKALRDYFSGKISGKRAAKEFIDASAEILGGAVFGLGGAAVGAIGGPVGVLVGGIAASYAGYKVCGFFMDYATQKMFNIPRERALEAAYDYFEVTMNSTNDQINHAFRQKCLATHPDKGGKTEEFLEVQFHMTAIRELRRKQLPLADWIKSGFNYREENAKPKFLMN